jgi:hypothetical protein
VVGLVMAWLERHEVDSKQDHDKLKLDLAKLDGLHARRAGRAVLDGMAAGDSADAERAREILALEQDGGGFTGEPDVVR